MAIMSDNYKPFIPYFVKSLDNGQSWEYNHLKPENSYYIRIVLNKNEEGFILSEGNNLYTTSDGGHTWFEHNFDSSFKYIWDIKIIKDSTYLLYSLVIDSLKQWQWEIAKTENKGLTWVINKCPYNTLGLNKLCFINENEGWFGGYVQPMLPAEKFRTIVIYHTTDAGLTWEKQFETVSNISSKFWECHFKFYDRNYGIFASFNSDVYLTTNGGKIWGKQITLTDSIDKVNFNDVDFATNNTIFCLDESGLIFKYTFPISLEIENKESSNINFYIANLFPQPATNQVKSLIYWDTSIDITDDEINVYDIYGQKVAGKEKITIDKQTAYNGILTWDCSNVTSGIYLIYIKQGTKTWTQKVMVNR